MGTRIFLDNDNNFQAPRCSSLRNLQSGLPWRPCLQKGDRQSLRVRPRNNVNDRAKTQTVIQLVPTCRLSHTRDKTAAKNNSVATLLNELYTSDFTISTHLVGTQLLNSTCKSHLWRVTTQQQRPIVRTDSDQPERAMIGYLPVHRSTTPPPVRSLVASSGHSSSSTAGTMPCQRGIPDHTTPHLTPFGSLRRRMTRSASMQPSNK